MVLDLIQDYIPFLIKQHASAFVTMTNEFTSEAASEGLTTAPAGSSLITTAAGHVEGFLGYS